MAYAGYRKKSGPLRALVRRKQGEYRDALGIHAHLKIGSRVNVRSDGGAVRAVVAEHGTHQGRQSVRLSSAASGGGLSGKLPIGSKVRIKGADGRLRTYTVAAHGKNSPAVTVTAPKTPTLKEQAASHRAGKGDPRHRALLLAQKAQKRSKSARRSAQAQARNGKADVAARKDAAYRANFARSEALAIRSGIRAPKQQGKVIDTKFTILGVTTKR